MKEFLNHGSSIVFRLADGTLKKFYAVHSYDETTLDSTDVTNYDRWQMGDITEEEYDRRDKIERIRNNATRERRYLDNQLVAAWKNYYGLGVAHGFSKPTMWPPGMQKIVDDIVWESDSKQKILTYKGLSFVIERPA